MVATFYYREAKTAVGTELSAMEFLLLDALQFFENP
ncbi:hypothetical protein T07_10214 [Trichinella nelsoni]|uniref:Uncharacterized protein n=1 Tax=Trichinella nelsoni TaxID=6336 RepID=A0A0V0RAH5_9BILA|nr:hypothetical protein T07_10214 [Trichinella nelsoni]